MSCANVNLKLVSGVDFSQVFRWGQAAFTWKPITAVPSLAPVRLTAVAHGLTDGWPFTVGGVVGTPQLNRPDDPYYATVVDPDTVEINDLDGTEFDTYLSGGFIRYNTPVDLTGFKAVMQIRASLNAPTALLDLTDVAGITIDPVAKTIMIALSATQVAALGPGSLVYSLDLISAGGIVTQLVTGSIQVAKSVNQ